MYDEKIEKKSCSIVMLSALFVGGLSASAAAFNTFYGGVTGIPGFGTTWGSYYPRGKRVTLQLKVERLVLDMQALVAPHMLVFHVLLVVIDLGGETHNLKMKKVENGTEVFNPEKLRRDCFCSHHLSGFHVSWI